MSEYFISVDLGQQNDYTAISVLEKTGERGFVRHLERLPLGMSYPEQVKRIKVIYDNVLKFRARTGLILDFTGVGRAVSDLLTKEGLKHIKLTITGGNEPHIKDDEWHLPKIELISALLVAIQTRQLSISHQLPDSEVLIKELLNFKMKQNAKTSNFTFEAREGLNDDLVLSVAMAAYVSGLGKPSSKQISRPNPGHNNRGFPVKHPAIGFERRTSTRIAGF